MDDNFMIIDALELDVLQPLLASDLSQAHQLAKQVYDQSKGQTLVWILQGHKIIHSIPDDLLARRKALYRFEGLIYLTGQRLFRDYKPDPDGFCPPADISPALRKHLLAAYTEGRSRYKGNGHEALGQLVIRLRVKKGYTQQRLSLLLRNKTRVKIYAPRMSQIENAKGRPMTAKEKKALERFLGPLDLTADLPA